MVLIYNKRHITTTGAFIMKSRNLSLLTIALSAALSPIAFATEQAADEQNDSAQVSAKSQQLMPSIEVIRVDGDRVSHAYNETGTVVLINRQQIEAIQPLSTEDILRRIPGINIKGEEETSIVANFGLRGLSASESKSLLLEDGVPVAPGLFIGNDRYFNPRIQRIDTVEVLKGSASLRYGPSTIGGVVNYITKTPDDGVKLAARIGAFDLREATLEAGARSADNESFAGVVVSQASSDGFMDKGYDMSDVMVKAGTQLPSNQRVGIKLSYHSNDANISYRGILLEAYNNGERYNPAPDDWYLTDRVAIDLNHEWLISDTATLKTLLYWSEVSRDYWRYAVDTAASNSAGRWVYTDNLTGNNRSFDRIGIESRLAWRHEIGGMPADSEFGLRIMSEESDDKQIRATRANDRTGNNARHLQDSATSYAGYLQTRIAVNDQLSLTPGIRIESYQQERVVFTQSNANAKTTNTEVLPGVGFTYELSNTAQLYGGIYRAFSPASNGVALDGLTDQQLDGERSTNYEIGVRGDTGQWRYEVAAFTMDFANQVVTGNSDPNLSQSNAGATEHHGMEFALAYDFDNGWVWDTNATWIPKSEFLTGTLAGNRLPYAPKVLANMSLAYQYDKLNTVLSVHHRGEQFGTPDNRIDIPSNAAGGIWGGLLPAYTVFDLASQYQVNEQLQFVGAIKNLTDENYISGLRQGIYVGPKRTIEIGFRYNF
jgi:Fe(3+) dicitrate transport protein